MELDFREKLFNQELCSGNITKEINGDIVISGNVESETQNPDIIFWAAAPADHMTSFSGSGLPFPNPDVAFENTPNTGKVATTNGRFSFRIKYPNAYYATLGTGYIPPSVNIKICGENEPEKITSIKIDDGIPFRSLTHIKNHNVAFYNVPEQEVRTQEQILRSSGYPSENVMPSNHWGLKPPK
tara:strand:+ start:1059 stop:1610 length:552 start_codon:yes stop_codon:yes gene_type:complete